MKHGLPFWWFTMKIHRFYIQINTLFWNTFIKIISCSNVTTSDDIHLFFPHFISQFYDLFVYVIFHRLHRPYYICARASSRFLSFHCKSLVITLHTLGIAKPKATHVSTENKLARRTCEINLPLLTKSHMRHDHSAACAALYTLLELKELQKKRNVLAMLCFIGGFALFSVKQFFFC